MAAEERIRPNMIVVLAKLQSAEGSIATLSGSTDAVPIEADGFSWTPPYQSEKSNEANGSLVAGAPLVTGTPVKFQLRWRIKGAGAGTTYSASIKPPHHVLYSNCGWRGLFTAAVAATAAAAGTTSAITLASPYVATAQAYRGMPLVLTGVAAGEIPMITDYTAARVATLPDLLGTAATVGTNAALPANWTYAGTTPLTSATKLTDHPFATYEIYRDGRKLVFMDVKGTMDVDGNPNKPWFASASFTGVFVSDTDAAVPAATIAGHSAPIMVQGSALSEAFLVNRKPLAIGSFKLAASAALDAAEDPNTANGYAGGVIGGREPMLTIDPLATLIANRDTLTEIGAFTQYTAVMRAGYTSGNRVAMTFPVVQPVQTGDGNRSNLMSENLQLRVLNTAAQDAALRDGDAIMCFS